MLSWVREKNLPNLILFVHGLKGGMDTWESGGGVSFPSLIKDDPRFSDVYDIACFNYFTTFTSTYGASKNVFRKFFRSKVSRKKNLPVQDLSELLGTELKVNLCGYDHIVLIAHSMGGLISKACILSQIEEGGFSSVKGFVSLAVPHSGAKIANIGGLVSSNVQLNDLSVLSDATDAFSREWLKACNKPKAIYIYASNDPYVDKKSAMAIGSEQKDSMAVDEDHSSICKPKDSNVTVYKAVAKFVEDVNCEAGDGLTLQSLSDKDQYNDEYFVIKMVLADIHEDITGHAKEYFFNAELMRKVYTSDNDRKALETLYKKIKHLYQEEYEEYIASDKTSDKFIASVHSRVMKEDSNYLNFVSRGLDSVHKKGMLHQLSNSGDRDIIWSKDTLISDIDSVKGGG